MAMIGEGTPISPGVISTLRRAASRARYKLAPSSSQLSHSCAVFSDTRTEQVASFGVQCLVDNDGERGIEPPRPPAHRHRRHRYRHRRRRLPPTATAPHPTPPHPTPPGHATRWEGRRRGTPTTAGSGAGDGQDEEVVLFLCLDAPSTISTVRIYWQAEVSAMV